MKSVNNLLLSAGIICMCMMQIHCSKGPSNTDFLTFKAEMFMRSGEVDRAQEEISKALTEDAKKMVSTNFSSKHNGSRFPAFWGPNYDWVPDQDHGNITMRALQAMLVQSEKGQTYMLPAWPKDWDVQFKVNITGREQISGNYTQQKGLVLEKFNKNIPMKIMETK